MRREKRCEDAAFHVAALQVSAPRTWTGIACESAPDRGTGSLAAARFVQLRVDRSRSLRGHARDALELLLGRCNEALGRAEVLQQGSPPRRAHSLQLVEDRSERPSVAALPVETDREPVGLVTHALEELQPGRMQ